MEEGDDQKRKRRGRSASGEVDESRREPELMVFEKVEEDGPENLDEFVHVADDDPQVDWTGEEDRDVVEERWEAILEDLFAAEDEDLETFEEVFEGLQWSPGEVIWEGADFDQVFSGAQEFHAFELLSKKEKRAFLRERLGSHDVSSAVEATDGEISLSPRKGKTGKRSGRKGARRPRPKGEPGALVSYETETEHKAEELDIGITAHGKRRRRSAR